MEDHDGFTANLRGGWTTENMVVAVHRMFGFESIPGNRDIRPSTVGVPVSDVDAAPFRAPKDLTLPECDVHVGIKGRDDLVFTCPQDYTYKTGAYVDTVGGWDSTELATIIVSKGVNALGQQTFGWVVALSSTQGVWDKEYKRDSKRGIYDWFWNCPRTHLLDWHEYFTLLLELKERRSANGTP
jgi:hypothetical protein